MSRTRWILPGQLGPLFDDGGPMLLIESRSLVTAAPLHRAKAHLLLSAIRHRAAELGERGEYVQVDNYLDALAGREPLEVINPPSYAERKLANQIGAEILPSRGFVTSERDFAEWAATRGKKRLLMEDFYRAMRLRTGILMEGDSPVGGQYNFDHDNRLSPPKGAVTLGLPEPWWPVEDDIDAAVREDLDRWQRDGLIRLVGDDGVRKFAATADEAQRALDDFVESRLNDFGPYEDATLSSDWTMAHSLLSAPMNLGLIDPRQVIDTVNAEYTAGRAPLASVEGVVRQIGGWRDWVWHLYWHLGENYATEHNALNATTPLPKALLNLDNTAIEANCLSQSIGDIREHGWVHHIPRLMIIGNWALQRGYEPKQLNDWFIAMFVDGTDWVMPANVIGMSQHADGGIVATKPYASGGAYISKMTNYCAPCRFNPKVRLGPDACPFTAGYWAFLDRTEDQLRSNFRMAQPLAGLRRLSDREAVVEQEAQREGL
ncbi:MAG: cryptochrome/photolyase family protein [Microbacteriaceae bacterium]|nr:cryptochrome/photolyase family protein [Microbacteriaceae bacterium]